MTGIVRWLRDEQREKGFSYTWLGECVKTGYSGNAICQNPTHTFHMFLCNLVKVSERCV